MIINNKFKGVVKLTSDQYQELKTVGYIVIDGKKYEYDPYSTLYMTDSMVNAILYTPQELTEEQKLQARINIGAGTSNFSGSYNDLTDKPEVGEPIAEAIRDNTTQITPIDGGLEMGGAKKTNCLHGIVIGEQASANNGGNTDNGPVVIGYKASVTNQDDAIAIGREALVNSGHDNISIGHKAEAYNAGSIAIGGYAYANGDRVAIGKYAKCHGNNRIQFGNSGRDSDDHSNIGHINFGGKYNSFTGGTSYDTITLYNKVVNNTEGYHKLAFEEEVKPLLGETDPTTTTFGNIGQFYLNTDSKALWQCVAITTTTDATTYTWQLVGGAGEKKYLHVINFWVTSPYNFGGGNYHLEIISSVKDPIGTKTTDLAKFLYENNYDSYSAGSSSSTSKGPCIVSNRFASVSGNSGSSLARTMGLYGQYSTTYNTYTLYATTDLIQANKAIIKINNTQYNVLQELYDYGSTSENITNKVTNIIRDTVIEL